MLEGLNHSETERQIFECILEFLMGGYKVQTLLILIIMSQYLRLKGAIRTKKIRYAHWCDVLESSLVNSWRSDVVSPKNR